MAELETTLRFPFSPQSLAMNVARPMSMLVLFGAALFAVALPVAARKPCEELQAEIEAKIKANGVAEFTLTVIDAAAESDTAGKVVGSCDGGAKRIVYRRGETSTAEVAATPAD